MDDLIIEEGLTSLRESYMLWLKLKHTTATEKETAEEKVKRCDRELDEIKHRRKTAERIMNRIGR